MNAAQRFAESLGSLNADQRDAVACDCNCVVTAGAGSGKTTVLAHRFLRLVIEKKARVDEILTLTFSRMAAAEMFGRIHAKLHEYRDDFDVRQELNRFGEATITTIDAFCNRIVSSDPLRYGLGPEVTMDEEANREMAAQCAHQVCLEMADHRGLRLLASLYGPEELIDTLLVGIAVSRFHPSTSFEAREHAQIVSTWIEEVLATHVDRILGSYRHIAALEGSTKGLQDIQAESALVCSREELHNPSVDPQGVLSLLRQLGPGKIRGKQDYVGICNEQVDIIRNALPLACAACAALADRDSIDAVYEVLERLHRTYLAMKRERGLLTFGDIAHMARDILLHNGHVRSYFQRKFRYIMVDEFQDTNRLQKDLVYLLAQDPLVHVEGIPDASQLDRKKLFFVGDEKQSIYRFRGADVSVFKQLDKEITASGGRRIVLETNYRSEPPLIDLFNTLFARIMGDASLAYEATFQPLLSREAYPFIRSRIGLMYKPKAQDPTPAEDDEEEEALDVQAEAYAIANLINRMTSSDEYLVPDRNGGIRRPHHEDIAVLFRTSANQMHYEKALRIAGIPYRLSAIQSLFLEAPANDLYLFLQLVVHPDDKLAFAGVMRSPFCRLSDDVLPLVLERMEEGFPAVEDLLPDDAQRLAYAQCTEVYDRLCRLSGTASVAELVSLLWHEGGYRYHLLSDPLFHVYLEHYDYLLELAIGFDGRNLGLADFLDFLRPRLGQRENLSDIEPLRASEHGVRIMTIHKSKGLEFPIVILASMGSAPKHMTTPAWYDAPHGEDAIPVPRHMQPYGTVGNILFERDKEMLLGMERAEMKRLFYVALTRAQTHLILSGCVNAQNMGEKSADRNFLALFEHHTGIIADHQALGSNFQVDIIERAPVSILRASVEQSVVDARVETMAACYGTPAPRRIVVPSSVAVTAISHGGQEVGAGAAQRLPGIASDTIIEREGLGKAFGTWCHAIVELALAASQEASLDAAAQHAMPIEIRRSSLSRQELGVLTSDATALADGFLSSRAFAALRERHPCSIESEVGFSMRLDEDRGVVANGSIDVLLRYEDHVRIIDFKTDLLRVPQIHARQLELYREAARRLYGLPVFSAICYLRDAERLEWIAGA